MVITSLIAYAIATGLGAAFLWAVFFTVNQQEVYIIERLGKFHRTVGAGLHLKIPLVEQIVASESLRVQQLDVKVETKTKDNVFLVMKVSVQYRILKESVYNAYYELQDAESQISSYIFDTVRAEVPKQPLDDVFEKKDEIAKAIQSELSETIGNFGYDIIKALVTDIDPDKDVKDAMNKINAATRLKEATVQEAEAEKIRVVKKAEAEAESKKLQGKGIADQRREIANGLAESVELIKTAGAGSGKEAFNILMLNQFYDTQRDVAQASRTNTIFFDNGPGALGRATQELTAAMIAAESPKERSDES